jgi:hypothetical protein
MLLRKIIFLSLCFTIRLSHGQNEHKMFWALNQTTYILTQLSTQPSTAYSLRKLKASYTGKAINVRRSSDNTRTDIGFTPSGDLDTATLKAWVGSGNGYIYTWYDQSGNKNATQSTAANQPQIVSSGAIIRQNNLPSVYFNGSNYLVYSSATSAGGNVAHSLNCVGRADNGVGNFIAYSGSTTANRNSCLGSGNNYNNITGAIWIGGYSQDGGYAAGSPIAALAVRTKTYTPSPSVINTGYVDRTFLITTNTAFNLDRSDIILGIQDNNTTAPYDDPLTGYISEAFLFLSSISNTVRLALEVNQQIYYNTP